MSGLKLQKNPNLGLVYLPSFLLTGGLPVARGSAACLQFNCMLVLLPVCRNLLSCIKNIPLMPRKLSRVLDENITFHKAIAYTICLFTAIHVSYTILLGIYDAWNVQNIQLKYTKINSHALFFYIKHKEIRTLVKLRIPPPWMKNMLYNLPSKINE